MAVDYYSNDHNEHKVVEEEEEEDDYIDMEVSSFIHPQKPATTSSSPPHQFHREFEFQMLSSIFVEKGTTASPADELFYKGKLLPLHLPPRLQMVENLLHDSAPASHRSKFNESYGTPLGTRSATTPTQNSTPFESCNVSPAESCQVSRELNKDEYFGEYGNVDVHKDFVIDHRKRSWAKKLRIKIKSLFGKSENKDETSSSLNEPKDAKICHRRSFSGAFKRRSLTTTKLTNSSSSGSSSSSSSSSASCNSNGLKDVQVLKRSGSANSEMETSLIQGAIAHCKQSQHAFRMRKTLSEIGFLSLSSTRLGAYDDQTTEVCRG